MRAALCLAVALAGSFAPVALCQRRRDAPGPPATFNNQLELSPASPLRHWREQVHGRQRSGSGSGSTSSSRLPSNSTKVLVWRRHEQIGIGNAIGGMFRATVQALLHDRDVYLDSVIIRRFCECVRCGLVPAAGGVPSGRDMEKVKYFQVSFDIQRVSEHRGKTATIAAATVNVVSPTRHPCHRHGQANYHGVRGLDSSPDGAKLDALLGAVGCPRPRRGVKGHPLNLRVSSTNYQGDEHDPCLYRKVLRALILGPGKRLRTAGHAAQALARGYVGAPERFAAARSLDPSAVAFDAVVHLRTLVSSVCW